MNYAVETKRFSFGCFKYTTAEKIKKVLEFVGIDATINVRAIRPGEIIRKEG